MIDKKPCFILISAQNIYKYPKHMLLEVFQNITMFLHNFWLTVTSWLAHRYSEIQELINRVWILFPEFILNIIEYKWYAQEMPQSCDTACWVAKRMRWGTNNNKANASYETTEARTKKNCNRETTLKRSVWKRGLTGPRQARPQTFTVQSPTIWNRGSPRLV